MREQATAKATADPCGMTNKRASNDQKSEQQNKRANNKQKSEQRRVQRQRRSLRLA
jgi:hypothetical protein